MSSDLHASVWQWIQPLPLWQRDLLRRVMVLEDLADSEVDDAVAMVLRHFAVHEEGPLPLPISALPLSAKIGTIRILALANLVDVGAISDGQRLEFKPDTLNIVYGDTGSGKTSYARVLRKACRSSAKPIDILPNILSTASSASEFRAGTADIEINIDGKASKITRDVNDPPEELLGQITVFDSDCADVYVNEENELIYTPSHLRLLERLASFQDQIRKRIQSKITELSTNTLPLQSFDPATQAGKLVNSLSSDISMEMVESLANWTATDASRLEDLRAQVSTSRAQGPVRIDTSRKRIKVLQDLATTLDSLDAQIGDNALKPLAALDSSSTELQEVPATLPQRCVTFRRREQLEHSAGRRRGPRDSRSWSASVCPQGA